MWMFRGSRAWSQWGVVHRFHVLLACRKFWFWPCTTAAQLEECKKELAKHGAALGELNYVGDGAGFSYDRKHEEVRPGVGGCLVRC
jgi:hypothetical protein